MDVVLVSARGEGPLPHWSQTAAAVVAGVVAAAGANVTWLCPLSEAAAPPAVTHGVALEVLRGRTAPYRRVLGRVADTAIDVSLARWLRPRPRAVVAHLGFGAPGSVTTLWIGERMGARTIAVVRAVEVLCHRGTLVDDGGRDCREFLDAARCGRCACAPWPGGLTARQARWAQRLRGLGAFTPFPNENAFRSRFDLVLGSLSLGSVLVATEAEAELLRAGGPALRSVTVVGSAGGPAPASAAVAAEILAQSGAEVAPPGNGTR